MRFYLMRFGTGIILVSVVVFLHTIFSNLDHGFWHDEVISLKFASPNFNFTESFKWWANFEPHPYTYYFLLRIWFLIAGFEEYSAKLFNPLIFILCALLSYRIWPPERRREFIYYLSLNMTSVWAIYYLIEVRPYGAMLSVAMLAAACIFALQHYFETNAGADQKHYRPFNYLTGCVIALAALDSWGVLLGGGVVVFVLLRYPVWRARIIDKWPVFIVLTIATGVLMLQYLNIVLVYDGLKSLGETLGNFSLNVSSWQFISIMLGEFWNHLYVTGRSQIVAIAAIAVWAGALVLNRRVPVDDILIYLGPVAFAYGVVLILHGVLGQAFYRHYSSLLLSPFVFSFLLSSAFRKAAKPMVSVLAISLFILANIFSVPIFERFPDKPRHIEYVDNFEPKYR